MNSYNEKSYSHPKTMLNHNDQFDEHNNRIIQRDTLFQDPYLVYQPRNKSNISVWTEQQGWKKASNNIQTTNKPISKKKILKNTNKLQKKLTAATAVPVNLGKAESMMQKMGWSGGALGRSGQGLVEPITPNAVYALKTRGFGQAEEVANKKRKKTKPQFQGSVESLRQTLKTNALLLILEFVKNERDIELVFESSLNNWERKAIHMLVEMINNHESDRIDLSTDVQKDIYEQICEHNMFELVTESDGSMKQRTLHLFKEAPDHVYLVTAADLRPEEEDEEFCIDLTTDDDKVAEKNNEEVLNIGKDGEIESNSKEIIKIPSQELENVDRSKTNNYIKEIDLATKTEDGYIKEIAIISDRNIISSAQVGADINFLSNSIDLGNEIVDLSKNDPSKDIIKIDSKTTNSDQVKTDSKNLKNTIDQELKNEIINLETSDELSDLDEKEKDYSIICTNKITKPHKINKKAVKDTTKKSDKNVDVIESLIEYFVEFLQEDKYTEFRFLGAFNFDEIGKINELINGVHACLNDQGSEKYAEISKLINWQHFSYEIKEDCNSSIVFHKSRR